MTSKVILKRSNSTMAHLHTWSRLDLSIQLHMQGLAKSLSMWSIGSSEHSKRTPSWSIFKLSCRSPWSTSSKVWCQLCGAMSHLRPSSDLPICSRHNRSQTTQMVDKPLCSIETLKERTQGQSESSLTGVKPSWCFLWCPVRSLQESKKMLTSTYCATKRPPARTQNWQKKCL